MTEPIRNGDAVHYVGMYASAVNHYRYVCMHVMFKTKRRLQLHPKMHVIPFKDYLNEASQTEDSQPPTPRYDHFIL